MLPGVEFARKRGLHHQASSAAGGYSNIHRSKQEWACRLRLTEEQRQKMMDAGHVSDVVILARQRLEKRLHGPFSVKPIPSSSPVKLNPRWKDAQKEVKGNRKEKGRRKWGYACMTMSPEGGIVPSACFLFGRVPFPICLL